MRFQIALLGAFLCLAAQTAVKPSQGAPAPNKSAPAAQESLTGCIDEQDGHYVLLNDQMTKIVSLKSAGSDQEVFAKQLGRKVQVSGTRSSEPEGTFKVTTIARVTGNCGPAR